MSRRSSSPHILSPATTYTDMPGFTARISAHRHIHPDDICHSSCVSARGVGGGGETGQFSVIVFFTIR